MSKSQCELYINNQLVEFNTVPTILFTYEHSELYNPSVLRNTFSKTIDIDGTPNNNKIFSSFCDNKWVVGGGFNPLRKETFHLYLNGELIESGYVKLDKVNKNGNIVSYSVSLYGGLGQFFYNLQSKEDSDDNLKLSDLSYPYDLNIEVNNKNVLYAWQRLNGDGTSKSEWMGDDYKVFDFINFAPAFNGIPTDFAADKVAIDVQSFINADDTDLANQFKTSLSGYTTINGWVLGELEKDYDEFQAFDLRSYLQRPVVRVKEIINACCNPENNGGYEVDLDKDFFNDDNPYWNDAWLTLPMVREMVEDSNITPTINGDIVTIPTNIDGNIRLSVNLNLLAYADTNHKKLYTGVYAIYQGNIKPQAQYNRAFEVKLEIYKQSGIKVTESAKYLFYSDVRNTNNFDFTDANAVEGAFVKQADGSYVFNNASYNLSTPTFTYESGMYGKLVFGEQVINKTNNISDNVLFSGTDGNSTEVSSTVKTAFFNESIRFAGDLGYKLTQKTLLNTEHTPCDYFLSFIKMFNLHIWKDKDYDKIYVRQRNNYYTNNVIDLEGKIDIGGEVSITPLNFDAKFYNFQFNMDTSEMLYKNYIDEYGIPYGIQKVNTNYGFDNSTKEIFEKNVFKGAITARKMSKYNIDLHHYITEDIQYPPYMLDGCRTLLFKDDDTIEGSVISPKTSATSKQLWKDKHYSLLPMANFTSDDNKGVDGSGVLLFYSGKVGNKNIEGEPIRICITDDIPEFEQLNEGDSCWIWTYNNSIAKRPDYIPMFSRYITNENGWITHSWDFGTPRALYVPDYTIDESSSIYAKYWKPYIQDAYNVNTRVLECKVLLNDKIDSTYLRNFFYFDGCYWCMHKITDYDATSNNTTKCTFVRINNLNSYLS